MAFGSMVEADSRIRQYEAHVRLERRLARERVLWQQLQEYEDENDK